MDFDDAVSASIGIYLVIGVVLGALYAALAAVGGNPVDVKNGDGLAAISWSTATLVAATRVPLVAVTVAALTGLLVGRSLNGEGHAEAAALGGAVGGPLLYGASVLLPTAAAPGSAIDGINVASLGIQAAVVAAACALVGGVVAASTTG
jgi:hypothetical protein